MEDKFENATETIVILKGYFQEMLLVARRQLDLFTKPLPDRDLVTELTELVEQRQKIMDNIDTVRRQLQEKEDRCRSEGKQTTADDDGYEFEKNEITKIIISIQETDNITRDKAGKAWQEIGEKLGNARKNKQAMNQYQKSPAYNGSWFIDKTR